MSAAKVMPVDLAMHMCLNRHPSVEQLLGMSTLRSHRAITRPSIYDTLRSKASRSPPIPESPVSPVNSTSTFGTLKKKKRVVFADDKGLALTAVWIFNSDPPISDEEELSSPVKQKTDLSVQSKKPRLRLGFPQPSADLPSFLEKLAKTLVHLESCSLVYGSLFGKVRVCNISPEKAVHIRITYDSWRSHHDIPCTPIQQNNENSDTELFFFNVPVPSCPNIQDRLEFCVSFRPGSGNTLWWDSNDGRNYQILVEDVNSEEASAVEKKPLRPQIFQSIQSVRLRNGPPLYRSASLSSLISPMNMMKTSSRQWNIIPKSNSFSYSNNADKYF
ncbi:protein phosphatase 1 regulatory subunit 3C-B-like [Ictalurus furcatus]|uniref:protein phosphatase 1 regulatory subunit 3C-B-like n=1 Tax=Ictalurus furcatus TaxID=66913 RepID=UPI00234FEF06|nr:protein phosphatase 1 regulatory subunit 3C-B-like [Ictalurus furcatus]XP_053501568.1 protein phosphatase 1 regulatory subunit 3C-B-like [Ictalurus furcatus]